MLTWLRKYSRSWFIALAIGAIVVVFIFWGVGGLKSPQTEAVAEVNGVPIPAAAYMRQLSETLKQYQDRAKGELTEEMVKSLKLKEQVVNRLIEEALLLQAGERLGLQVSDPELQEQIRSYPFFQEDGKFNERLYFLLLGRSRIAPGDFEVQERRRLLLQKVVQEVTAFAKVSDIELQEMFRLGKEAVEVKYLVIGPEKFLASQRPDEAAVTLYYQENQEKFRLPTRVKVNYLLFKAKDFLEQAKLEPREVEDYLQEHQEEFTRPKEIRVRQLLLTVPPKASPEERQLVEKKAQDLLARTQTGEDFAQLADTHSQDKLTRGKGGDLGPVKRGQYSKEWEQVAFFLKPGEAGLASTPQGFYLIKVEEVKEVEKLPDAEAKATQRLKEAKARKLAQETAQRARGELAGDTLAAVAKKYHLTPQETPLFGMRDPLPGLGVRPNFHQAAMKLKPKEVSPLVDLVEGYAVLQGVESIPEHVPGLDQIKDQVQGALKGQMAGKQAEQEAEQLLQRLRKGEALEKVAAQSGFPLKDSGFFTRFQGFLNQPAAEAVTGAAFQLSKEHPYPDKPISWQDKYYLLAFKARRAPDPAEFQKERETLEKNVLDYKRQLLLSSWMGGERRRAKIKVFELPF